MRERRKPYPHQREHFEKYRDRESMAVFWEMGCTDLHTEYLTPQGWRYINSYGGGTVAQWNPQTGDAEFVLPLRYIVRPCDEFIQFYGLQGLDQKLSPDHRVYCRSRYANRWDEQTAEDLEERIKGTGSRTVLPATFTMNLHGEGTGLTEAQLRLQIAVMADGNFQKTSSTHRCRVSVKKNRKKKRLSALLEQVGQIPHQRHTSDGYTVFSFDAPLRIKKWPWWDITNAERDIILDEVWRWDGSAAEGRRGWRFFSNHESDVDFIQFVAATAKLRTTKVKYGTGWQLNVRKNSDTHRTLESRHISRSPSEDGLAYCFQVPSGGLVLRRNGFVFLTGNCGKTKTALDIAAWQYLHGFIDTLFVVAPKGVHRNWVTDEIPEHLSPDVEKYHALWYQGSRMSGKGYPREINAALEFDGLLIVAMNYDALRTKAGFAYAQKVMKRRAMMILDESPRIKNPTAKVTKAAIKLGRKAVSRRILTGTPITNGPFDAYSQVDFLDGGFWPSRHFGTYTAFKNHYGIYNVEYLSEGRRYNALVGYKNVDSLYDILKPISDRKTKETVLDLPPKIYTKRYVEMTKEQTKLYNMIKEDAIAFLDNGEMITAQIVIVQMLRLQQIANGFVVTEMDQKIKDIDGGNPRIDTLIETLEECAPQQTIIWARFKHDIDLIAKRFDEEGITYVTYDGRTSDGDRAQAIDDFRSGKARVFLANPAAAGEGLTLTEATVVIYYSHTFKLAERLQSEDRAHRIGQEKPVLYIDFVCSGTMDDKIVSALRKKLNIASLITGDSFREWI